MPRPGRILVAMSGGVDSSVAAALLREAGHEVVGVTLHLWDADGSSKVGRCCAPEDREDARRSCDALGIPHYVIDEREAFLEHVVEPFLDEYRRGRTPIPCVHCNRTVKLVKLVGIAEQLGCTHVATGHYARLEHDADGLVHLLRGRDAGKDQSYFLFGLPQSTLARLVFPLGARDKVETRAEGRRLGVPNAEKPDSQELCFIPDGDVQGFVRSRRGPGREGRILDAEGRELGRHEDVSAFTVGQRRGLPLGGGHGSPRYVLRIVPDTHDVVVGEADALGSPELEAEHAHWTARRPERPFRGEVRIRYRHAAAPALVEPTERGFRVRFDAPQRAITPGQAAVVYVGDEVVGGGYIV
ncbi:MAG: tRNA 2-thiouridine(34) synthase MnmA [Polyangiales bacterium]